jgi:hypothetical protein
MGIIKFIFRLPIPACHIILSLSAINLAANAESTHEYFQCETKDHIVTSVYISDINEKRFLINWSKVVKGRSINRAMSICNDFALAMNSNIENKKFGYIIPGYWGVIRIRVK